MKARLSSFRIVVLVSKLLVGSEPFGSLVVRVIGVTEEVALLNEVTVAQMLCLVDMQGAFVAVWGEVFRVTLPVAWCGGIEGDEVWIRFDEEDSEAAGEVFLPVYPDFM